MLNSYQERYEFFAWDMQTKECHFCRKQMGKTTEVASWTLYQIKGKYITYDIVHVHHLPVKCTVRKAYFAFDLVKHIHTIKKRLHLFLTDHPYMNMPLNLLDTYRYVDYYMSMDTIDGGAWPNGMTGENLGGATVLPGIVGNAIHTDGTTPGMTFNGVPGGTCLTNTSECTQFS